MRVQTLQMAHVDAHFLVAITQGHQQAAGGVLDEHQIAAVERGEGLFVGALDSGLHRGAKALSHWSIKGSRPRSVASARRLIRTCARLR